MTNLIDEHKAGIHAFQSGQEDHDTEMRLICIEGNIGAGKSTLAVELAKTMKAVSMLEPVEENPYLDRYYNDPKRFALEMQFWLMARRFQMHEQAIRHIWSTSQSVVMDRSIYGDWVFAKKNWLDGNIDDLGYQSYLHHREVMNRYLLVPHVVLFLDVSPEICRERIALRGRECESLVPLSYLKGVHELHRELALEMKARGSKVVFLDWSVFEEENQDHVIRQVAREISCL